MSRLVYLLIPLYVFAIIFILGSTALASEANLKTKLFDLLWLLVPVTLFAGTFMILEKKRKKKLKP